MNKKDLSTFILILLVFTILNFLLISNIKNKKEAAKVAAPQATETPLNQSAPKATRPNFSEELVTVETPLIKAVFTNRGGRLQSLQLKKYFQSDKKTAVELVPNSETPTLNFWLKGKEYLTEAPYKIQFDPDQLQLKFTYQDSSGRLTKTFRFHPETYLIDLEISGTRPEATGFLSWGPGLDEKILKDNQAYLENDGLIFKEGGLSRIKNKNFTQNQVSWAGISTKYFLAAFLPQNFLGNGLIERNETQKMTVGLEFPLTSKASSQFKIYAGPKDYDLLKHLNLGLEKTVDLGWNLIEPFSLLILFLLKFLHQFLGNYGLIIILLTVLIKIIFHPLSIKSFESTAKIQKIQPEIKKLQEKFKNQPEKLQVEMAQLYKTDKVNPFGGCLPILIQIPIFFALFSTLSHAIELRGSSFMLWITDLSRPDTIGYLAGFPINVLPILMGLSMFLQQKMMPLPESGTGASPQTMLFFMPILITVLFWGFPSGLVLYWFVNNLVSIGEQYLYLSQKPKN